MPGLVATIKGTCSGHGIAIPAQIHGTVGCNQPPCPPTGIAPKSLSVMDASCHWPALNTTPLDPSAVARTVSVEGTTPLCDGDALIYHKAVGTNIVIRPVGDKCVPTNVPCKCGDLTTEDVLDRGHDRIVKSTSTTVFINGKRVACVGDPLGPPCKSTIATGCATVIVGK